MAKSNADDEARAQDTVLEEGRDINETDNFSRRTKRSGPLAAET